MNKEFSKTRVDIAEQAYIDELFDINNVKFGDYINVIHDFFRDCIISGEFIDRLALSDAVKKKLCLYISAIGRYASGDEIEGELKDLRVNAWEEYRNQNGSAKAIVRVVLIGLYDKNSAHYDESDSSQNFEIIFSTLFDLGGEYCVLFRKFLEDNLIMKKYRI